MNQTAKCIVRILYIFAMVIIGFAAIGGYMFVRIHDMYDNGGNYEIVSAKAEKIGRTYEENTAPECVSYYRVSVKVKNTGQYADRCEDIYFEITTDAGNICIKEYGAYDAILQKAAPVAPAGRTANVENVVWVPDGSKGLIVNFGANTEGKGSAEIALE